MGLIIMIFEYFISLRYIT